MWPFKKKAEAAPIEKRSAASGYTAEIMSARESYISGRSGIAELTATAQSCVSLWENGFAISDISGTDIIARRDMAMIGRSLALRGESVFLIDGDELIPCADWDLRTRNGKPSAYKISISEAGGGRNLTALAGEVLHFRVGTECVWPWSGQAPLQRSSLTAGMLQAIEASLSEVFEFAPLGSQIVPFPETPDTDLTAIGRSFRGQRGRVLLRESTQVSAAGRRAPEPDGNPADVTPDLEKAVPVQALQAARDAISGSFGVLPALFNRDCTGPQTREAQRHLAAWTLQPICD